MYFIFNKIVSLNILQRRSLEIEDTSIHACTADNTCDKEWFAKLIIVPISVLLFLNYSYKLLAIRAQVIIKQFTSLKWYFKHVVAGWLILTDVKEPGNVETLLRLYNKGFVPTWFYKHFQNTQDNILLRI